MLSVVFALALSAAPFEVPNPDEATPNVPKGLFVGDHWRFKKGQEFGPFLRDMVVRMLADLVAIPASVVRWEPADYLTFGVGAAVPIVMSIPFDGVSPDVRLQREIHRVYGGVNCDYSELDSTFCPSPMTSPHVWTKPTDLAIVTTAIVAPLVIGLVAGLAEKDHPLAEIALLGTEAVLVAQVYHVLGKFLTGREAPLGSDGMGRYHGPTRITFPAGTPSGHSATLFAIAGTYATYYDSVWVKVVSLATAGILASLLVVDDSHFASEVVVGSMMGYLTARWVVEHRSTKYAYGQNGLPVRLMGVGPVAVRGQGAAFAATWQF